MKFNLPAKLLNYTEFFKILTGLVILGLSFYFLNNSAHFFIGTRSELGKYFDIKWVLLLHITGGGIALLTGPFLLWEKFRNYNFKIHRMLGKIYLIAVLLSSSLAVYLSCSTAFAVNWAYAFSLQVWVSIWILSSIVAYYSVIKRKIKLHKEWMTRSYIVTLAFVVGALLLKIPFVQNLGSFAEISPSIFWFAWAVPLYIYDLYLTSTRKQ